MQPAVPTAAKKPQPLGTGEYILAGLMMLAGVALVTATLVGISNSTSHFTFKSKETVTREPVQPSGDSGAENGAGGDRPRAGKKETNETEYADTLAVFALTGGVALFLAGGFYGRLRSLKLGDLELNLLGEEEKQNAEQKAADAVANKVTDPQKQPAAEAAAKLVAAADLSRTAAYGIKPTDPVVDLVAGQAAQKVAGKLG